MPDTTQPLQFTRPLSHSHSYKRRSSRPPTRSPSPFMTTSPPPAAEPQALRKRQQPARQPSSTAPNGSANGHAVVANGHAPNGNGVLAKIGEVHDDDAAVERAPSSADAKKIDWEIPRKTLHSSIGACAAQPAALGLTVPWCRPL